MLLIWLIWLCCFAAMLVTVTFCEQDRSFSWNNRLDKLGLSCKTSFCVSVSVCTEFTQACVCLNVHICSHVYLFHLLAACMLCKSVIVVSAVDARLASCVVLVHEWYAFGIPLPYRLVALTPSFCRPFLSTKQTGCWGHKGGPKGHAVWSDEYLSLIICEMNFNFMGRTSRN